MPRPLRRQEPNAIYHVTCRGNRKQPIFLENNDRIFHLWLMNKVATESEWEVFTYVQMGNHFHWLFRTPKPNLAAGMQRLNGVYGQFFNDHHGFAGHVFQGRFHSRVVETEAHLLECARYDDLNPVRAGLVDHPLEWRWGSLRPMLGVMRKHNFLQPDWLLRQFDADLGRARQRYLEFVEDALWAEVAA
jgi:putative transposase